MGKEIKNKYKLILITILVGFVLLLSELLYIYNINNNSEKKAILYFKVAIFASQKGYIDWAFGFLTKSALIGINDNKNLYPENISNNFETTIPIRNVDDKLRENFKSYLDKLSYEDHIAVNRYSYSRVFYDLALIAFEEENFELATKLFQYAYYLSPNTSFWPVELANYYYSSGQTKEALSVLENCRKIESSKAHCSDFYGYLNSGKVANIPGFTQNEVEKFYGYPSLLNN